MSEQTRPSGMIRAVTPSDSANLPDGQSRGFHVNVAGNIKFTDATDNAVTLTVLAGVPYPYAAKRIWSTGTTATGIFGLY